MVGGFFNEDYYTEICIIYIYIGYRVMLCYVGKLSELHYTLSPFGLFLRVLNLFCAVKGVNNSFFFLKQKIRPQVLPSRAGPRVAKS